MVTDILVVTVVTSMLFPGGSHPFHQLLQKLTTLKTVGPLNGAGVFTVLHNKGLTRPY